MNMIIFSFDKQNTRKINVFTVIETLENLKEEIKYSYMDFREFIFDAD